MNADRLIAKTRCMALVAAGRTEEAMREYLTWKPTEDEFIDVLATALQEHGWKSPEIMRWMKVNAGVGEWSA